MQSHPLGCGLEGVFQFRRSALSGILNGIDAREWNPETDAHLAVKYNVESHVNGKAMCKAALQKEMGLPQEAETPLFGIVGRLSEQKGFDLILEVMQRWLQNNEAQWVILGTGDPKYQRILETLVQRFPQKLAVRFEFSNPLAHRIEAGADLFLMPSRYEPCGLNQLYSLRYGTVPVVRATGGLADTIVNLDDQSLVAETANGFTFYEYSALALSETLRIACETYRQKDVWNRLITTGMKQDWSWTHSAREYTALYQTTVERAKQGI